MKTLAVAACLLVASFCAAKASSVLYMGSDGFVDFNQIGTVGSCSNSYITGSGRSDGGVEIGNTTSTTDPPANRAQTSTFAASGGLWIHAQLRDGNGSSTNNEQALIIRSPDGVARILLRQTATYGILKLSTRNAAATITDVATATTPAIVSGGGTSTSGITPFDLHIDYAGGAAQLYLGTSNKVIDFSGSLETDAATTLNQVELMSIGQGAAQSGVANDCSPRTTWSEVIVTDTADTRGMVLMNLNPVATGTTQTWSGSAGNITDSNDSTVNSSSTNNQLSGWTTGTTLPSGSWDVLAISQSARVSRGATGPQNFDWYARTADGTDHLGGATNHPGLGVTVFPSFIWLTNPFTSSAWVSSDIATGFNLGLKSLP